jgi:hypothetical protein
VALGPRPEGELLGPAGTPLGAAVALGIAGPPSRRDAAGADPAGADPAADDPSGATVAGAEVAARTPLSGAGLGWVATLKASTPSTPTSSTADVSRHRRRRGE